jgi:16S rRNA (cytosine967-C5)-methyltransferase
MPVPTARSVAASVLVRVWKDGAFAAAALDAEVSRSVQLDPRDRALATSLVYGSLRVLPWIDARILRHAPRGLGGIDRLTHAELVLSAYQLFFLEKVPAFAAVNEAVEAVKAARGKRLAAFANAVLRKLATEAEKEKGEPLLREAELASLPDWLRSALARALGEEGAKAFCLAGSATPPLGIAVARAEERDLWVERLREAVPAASFEAGKVSPLCILARGGGKSDAWPGWEKEWRVQEEGSQLVGLSLGARAGERVLDACAGRGNKTLLLASLGARVDAADVHPAKLEKLEERLRAMSLPVGHAFAVDWTRGPGDAGDSYDRAIVDAPCSGSGTLRRRPDILLRRGEEDLARLGQQQSAILERVATRVRPGGRVVYAVCSVLREEAEDVVSSALSHEIGLVPAPFEGEAARALAGEETTLRLLPHVHGTDGYFLASFKRA